MASRPSSLCPTNHTVSAELALLFLPRTPQGTLHARLLPTQAAVTKIMPSLGLAQATTKAAGKELELCFTGPPLSGGRLYPLSQLLPAEFRREKWCQPWELPGRDSGQPHVPDSARTLLTIKAVDELSCFLHP